MRNINYMEKSDTLAKALQAMGHHVNGPHLPSNLVKKLADSMMGFSLTTAEVDVVPRSMSSTR
jgi:hypothetical protein